MVSLGGLVIRIEQHHPTKTGRKPLAEFRDENSLQFFGLQANAVDGGGDVPDKKHFIGLSRSDGQKLLWTLWGCG